jgi:hypothetical protein
MAMAAGALVIGQMVTAKATRDALFLTNHSVRELASMMLVAAAVSLAAVLAMTRAVSRLGPATAVPLTFGASATAFAAEWVLLPRAPGWTGVVVYLHIASFGGVTVSGFWSVVTERFDPRTAKQLVGRINAGAALGGLLGGLAAARCASWVGLRGMLVMLALMNGASALMVSSITTPERGDAAARAGPLDGLRLLREVPYLRLLAAVIGLTGAAAALTDYAFKAVVAERFSGGAAMAGFFAVFYGGASLTTFVVQAAFARPALQRIGLAKTMAFLPAGVLVTGLFGLAVTRLASVAVLRAVEVTASHSLFRSAYELFYTPLPPDKKRPIKTIIDVAFDRLGDVGGGVLVLAALAIAPGSALTATIGAAAVASALALVVCTRLHRAYVIALRDAVNDGTVALAPADAVDATTKLTLSQLSMVSPLARAQPADPVLMRIDDLVSGDLFRTRRALVPPLSRRLVPFVLPLVAHPEIRRSALEALESTIPRAAGQIADALLDASVPDAVRAHMPGLLAASGDQRSVDALVEGLRDPRFGVRARCARALATALERTPSLVAPREALFDAARLELDRVGHRGQENGERDRALSHVLALVGLGLREPALRLAWTALRSGDERLRGTALEYLDNVLPDVLHAAMWRHLEAWSRRRPTGNRAVLEAASALPRPARRSAGMKPGSATVRGAF